MTVSAQDQRPRFYEGQHLGADDLSVLVAYLRSSAARHALGAHTWGIAIGLQLTEKSAPGGPGRVEVTLQPGFAWDGYGRPVLNGRPTRLPEELFASIPYHPALDDVAAGGKGRLVPIWMAYAEVAGRNPAPGFETCATDDQHARIEESFRFEVGQQPPSRQRGSVAIGTASVDPLSALVTFDGQAPLLYDTSVPHQRFPADGNPPRWLIPIGYVRWIARDQALGYFADRDLDPADKAADRIRAFRRYIGAVAEYIEAADGAIVLHHRGRRPEDPHLLANLLAGTLDAKALLEDLVWVQGNLRVVGQAKLAGGDLHFRNADGLDEETPLYVARRGDNPPSGAKGQRELRVVIGPPSQTDNRLIVGVEQPPVAPSTVPGVAPHLVVVSSGRVGVGTASPATSLEVVGNWNGGEGTVRVTGDQPAIRFEGGAAANNQKWVAHVGTEGPGNLRLAVLDTTGTWKGVLHATPTARVGVGSPSPRNPFAVRASGTSEELVSFEDPGGTTKWHINQKLSGTTPGLNIVETGVADGRLFLKPGGDVGIGTVTPAARLTINGKVPQHGVLNVFSPTSDVEYDGGSDALFVFKHLSNGVTSFLQSRIGVGSTTPFGALAVRGHSGAEELVSFEDAAGNTRWHMNQALAGAPRGLNFAETGVQDGRLFLRQGGNVGIGTTDPQEKLHVAGSWLRVNGPSGEATVLGGEGQGAITLGTRDPNVSIVDMRRLNVPFSTASAGAWLTVYCRDVFEVSDERAKTGVKSITGALDRVAKLRGVSYRWRGESRAADEPQRLGLIAQEVEKVVPEAASGARRGGVSYSAFVPLLVEAVKELKAEVDALKAEVRKLSAARGSAGGSPRKTTARKGARKEKAAP
jgi:hypothetical protein